MGSIYLPPCQDTLNHYLKRVNCYFAFWKRSLEQDLMIPNPPVELGWEREIYVNLQIRWTFFKFLHEEILQILSELHRCASFFIPVFYM